MIESGNNCCKAEIRRGKTAPRAENEREFLLSCLHNGASKNISFAEISRFSSVDEVPSGKRLAGQTYNLASLLAEIGYSESMCVDLIALSAYMLQVASKADSLCVAGADIAVYRDTVGPFEFR